MEGIIYGDTLNVYEKLEVLENIEIKSEFELIDELKRISQVYDLSRYKRFMYQDFDNIFLIDYKDVREYLKKGR